MARRNELTCDRCGRTIVDLDYSGLHVMKDSSAKIHYWGVGAPRSYGEQRIDLCIKCAVEFLQFMSNEEIRRDD